MNLDFGLSLAWQLFDSVLNVVELRVLLLKVSLYVVHSDLFSVKQSFEGYILLEEHADNEYCQ